MRGVYSRPPSSSTARASEIPPQTSASRSHSSDSLTEGGSYEAADKPCKSSANKQNPVSNGESEPQDLTKSNGVASLRVSEPTLPNQHPGMVPSSHFVQQQMYMNGLPATQLSPHMVPPMPYHSPGLPADYNYPSRHPVQMMRAPNGQIFYRYAAPRLPISPQVMSYPVDNAMYPQMPFMAGQAATFGYPPPANNPTSPKRKRKKTGSKTIIESHSAVLARTEESETTASKLSDDTKPA